MTTGETACRQIGRGHHRQRLADGDTMITTILLVAASFVLLGGVMLAVWWMRSIEDELDYPEAHRSAAPPQDRAILRIGAGLSNTINTPTDLIDAAASIDKAKRCR
jgi:hypothetical protein